MGWTSLAEVKALGEALTVVAAEKTVQFPADVKTLVVGQTWLEDSGAWYHSSKAAIVLVA